MTTVSVIGLGTMGGSIARHLAGAGLTVLGQDLSPQACALARDHGVTTVTETAALDGHPGPIILSLPSASAARGVVEAIAAFSTPRLVIETSTLSLDEKIELRDTLQGTGHRLLDCPISGTGAQMLNRDVVVYASGDADALATATPMLQRFARQVLTLGEFGNGTRMKLIANHLVAVHNVAAAEAVLMGMQAGFSMETLQAAIGAGAGNSRMFELRGPNVASRSYEPAAMKLSLWAKDLELIEAFARDLGARTPLFDTVMPLYEQALKAGLGEQDTSAVAEVMRPDRQTGNSGNERGD